MRRISIYILVVCGVGCILAAVAPPKAYPDEQRIVIPSGAGIAQIAHELDRTGIVASKLVAQTIIILRGGERRVQAGVYEFDEVISAWQVATRLLNGESGIDPVIVRVPEGSTRVQMGDLFKAQLEDFDSEEFLIASNDLEGYLFPDTYRFVPTDSPDRVVEVLHQTFQDKTTELRDRVESAGKSFDEIVVIGSLIEGEVRDPIDRRLVSGVIQNRLDIGMPLQLDASFVYLLGKGSAELTLEDLEYDSPYNTYQNLGLPPGPIGSPSLDAMEAAFEPTVSNYLFYLSDEDGITHFAEDFETHKANKTKYLR